MEAKAHVATIDRVDYYPVNDRPKIVWPGNARVAFWVSPNVEYYEYMPSPMAHMIMYTDSPTPGWRIM